MLSIINKREHLHKNFYILLLLLIACSSKSEKQEVQVKVLHEFTLTDETQEHLIRLYTQVIDNPEVDELVFTNYGSAVGVVITDYQGNFIEKIGEKGRGPKELLTSRFFGAQDSNQILVLDKALALFKMYNRTSEEVGLFTYPVKDGISITSRNMSFCNEKWYAGFQLLGTPPLPSTPTIAIFDKKNLSLIDTLGGYDPFFNGRKEILQETSYSLDCENEIVYTVQGKTPKVQAFSTASGELLGSTEIHPPSFKVSEKFITMASNPQEMSRYLSEEQSISLHLAHNDSCLYLVFRNDSGIYKRNRVLNESSHFVGVYDKNTFDFIGEVKVSGAILGATKRGNLIMLKDEENLGIQIIEIVPKSS